MTKSKRNLLFQIYAELIFQETITRVNYPFDKKFNSYWKNDQFSCFLKIIKYIK